VFGAGAVAQATPVGWAADLIIAGLLAFGFWSVGSIIFEVIKDFAAFSSTALSAKSEADLNLAGYYFSNAVAKIGVSVVIAMIAHTAAKGMNAKMKASAAQRKAVSAQQIQAKLNAQKPSGSSSQPNTPASALVASGVLSQEFIKAFKSEPVARNAVTTYSKFPNWAEIQPIIGKAMSSSSVPKGYLYATIEGKQYYYLPGADKTKVPVIESNTKGNAYLPSKPSYRIADKNRYDRNFGQKIITSVNGSEIHHMIPDNVWRSEPFLQRLLAEGWANMDEKVNLIELAKSQSALDDVRKANPGANLSDVIHSSGHGLYDNFVTKTLEEVIRKMRLSTGKSSWEKFSKDEMLKVLHRTLNELRDIFMNEPDKLPKKKDGTLGFLPEQERDTA
jgi:A nuclease family of the HNH/ENDO VII superfamily with conserved AHH